VGAEGASLSRREAACHDDEVRPVPFWFLEALRPGVWTAARGLFRIRFEGIGHVPRTGPAVITPNHTSFMDPILVTIPIRRALHYMALEPFFRIRGLGTLMRWARAFPVQEDEPDSLAVRRALRILRQGEPLVIFPEGGRSPDGRLQPFHAGAFRLALAAGAPVVPVTIVGAFEAWPARRRLPRPGRITIRYHAPLDGSALPPGADRRARPELLMTLVRDRIASGLPA
jgi:1-acyl-sn-glycerol-3-phosphate acyltransferase